MEAITEKRLRALITNTCKSFLLTADYQQGNNALCWRVTFMEYGMHSSDLVGTSKRELWNAVHAFRYGMEFANRINHMKGEKKSCVS